MSPMRLFPRIIVALTGILVFVFVCGMAAYTASEVFGAPIPPSQLVSEEYNLCVEFEYNLGTAETVLMYTHRCDIPLEKDVLGFYDENDYLDMQVTMECPRIEVTDIDGDGFMEIRAVQEWLCKQFAHPWNEDAKELTFDINQDGKFIEIGSN